MIKYQILTQFLKADAKFDEPVKDAIKAAVENYNSKSLIAKNPKNIAGYTFSDDNYTMDITLESEEELPVPSKALRLLSTYLVNVAKIDSSYLSGKQLFKMSSSEVQEAPQAEITDISEKAGIDKFARLSSYMQVLDNADATSLPELDKINEQITDLLRRLTK